MTDTTTPTGLAPEDAPDADTSADQEEMSAEEYRAYRDEQDAVGPRLLGWLLAIGGAVGFFAAFTLTLERLMLLENPDYVPTCDINPVLTCGDIMQSDQASIFGFPNPLIGVATFPVVVLIGVLVASRVTVPKWVTGGFWLGTLGGFVMVHYLIFQSLMNLNKMCPYCMVVWTVMAPIFFYTTAWAAQRGALPLPAGGRRFLVRNRGLLLALWYIGVIAAAGWRFWDFWISLI